MLIRLQITICLLLLASVLNTGCCWRRDMPAKCCPPYASQRVPLSASAKPINAGVDADFELLPAYDSIKQSVLAQVAVPGTMPIELNEVVCLAAQNSQLAEVIDQERHLLQCQRGECCEKSSVDMILKGESLEQRNTAAGAAGELFLGLAQVSMQLQLLDEANVHAEELQTKLDAAEEAGFATADGKNELEKGRLQIQMQRSKLDSLHQELTWELNMLLNPDSDTAVVFEPVHRLDPQPSGIDVVAETSFAESNRPGIIATEMALASDCDGQAAYRLLKLFDSRLGMTLDAGLVKKQLLRKQLIEVIQDLETPDMTAPNRKQQASKIVDLRRREAAVSAGKALLDRQSALEKLTIIHADIERLQRRSEVLTAGKEIDADEGYLKENENWIELQKAKSDRIAAAFEYEVAQLKLKQAQGTLIQACGYRSDSDATPTCGLIQCNCQR